MPPDTRDTTGEIFFFSDCEVLLFATAGRANVALNEAEAGGDAIGEADDEDMAAIDLKDRAHGMNLSIEFCI